MTPWKPWKSNRPQARMRYWLQDQPRSMPRNSTYTRPRPSSTSYPLPSFLVSPADPPPILSRFFPLVSLLRQAAIKLANCWPPKISSRLIDGDDPAFECVSREVERKSEKWQGGRGEGEKNVESSPLVRLFVSRSFARFLSTPVWRGCWWLMTLRLWPLTLIYHVIPNLVSRRCFSYFVNSVDIAFQGISHGFLFRAWYREM